MQNLWVTVGVGLQLNALLAQATLSSILTSTHLPVLFVVDLLIARAVIVLVHRPWAAVEVGLPSDALIGIHSMIGKLYLCIVVNKIPANWFLVLMLFRL